MRTALDCPLKIKYERYRIRAKVRALGREGTNVAVCARLVETQRGNNAVIRSVIDGNERLVKGQDEMCEAVYTHFVEFFGKSRTLDHVEALQNFLAGSSSFSAQETECL